MTRHSHLTVIGGGLAGLVASIEAAERGCRVTLHEATAKLGGRARSLTHKGFTANQGPHALYANGPAWNWLKERKLLPKTVQPRITAYRVIIDGRPRRIPLPFLRASMKLRAAQGERDVDFRTWFAERAGISAVDAAIGYLTLPTFDYDPGRLSAAFAVATFQQASRRGGARYVVGGWSVLVEALRQRADDLGVRIISESRIEKVPDPPVIVATGPAAASTLLGDPSVKPEPRTVALLDLGVRARRRQPHGAIDLDRHVYLARYSASDPTLVPAARDLFQCSTPRRPDESAESARERIGAVLDEVFPHWRAETEWQRFTETHSPGAVDTPGEAWSDRPAVDRGDGVFLAGDYVAASGLLSEISFNSARDAVRAALLDLRSDMGTEAERAGR